MEWYWVLVLCWIAAGIGLLIGCMCRVAGRADNRAGLVKPGTWVYYPDNLVVSEIKPVVVTVKPDIVNYERARQVAKTAINSISKACKVKRKKFRWINYYKALKLIGRG